MKVHAIVTDLAAAQRAVAAGATVVQLRLKAPTAEIVARGRGFRDLRATFVVNDDVEAAIALGADGVHLPEQGLAIADVRARVGDQMLISRAVHGLEAAQQAADDGADLVQFGTVFATASKPGVDACGISGVRAICEVVRTPLIAIGGIAPESAAEVMAAGAAGVAVIGAIFDADDPRAVAGALRRAIDGGGA